MDYITATWKRTAVLNFVPRLHNIIILTSGGTFYEYVFSVNANAIRLINATDRGERAKRFLTTLRSLSYLPPRIKCPRQKRLNKVTPMPVARHTKTSRSSSTSTMIGTWINRVSGSVNRWSKTTSKTGHVFRNVGKGLIEAKKVVRLSARLVRLHSLI